MTHTYRDKMHHYELEWTDDLDTIFHNLTLFWMSMPSIIDTNGKPRLPGIFRKVEEAYENPHNTHKQALWLDRIKNPSSDIIEFLELFDKYNLHHNIEFFHMNSGPDAITEGFLPHQHKPGGVARSIGKDGMIQEKYTGENPGENETLMQSIHCQLTFPFINAKLGQTQWSAKYNLGFQKRRRFLEEEITGRYTLGIKPVLFDVMTWHQGRNELNMEDRLLWGIASKFTSFEEAVNFFKITEQSGNE